MKAVILKGFGGVENLVVSDIPVPSISDNEVLVRVKSFSINPVDIKTRIGRGQAERLKDLKPIILGWDISGTVVETGKLVTTFSKGDDVFGMVNFPGHGQAYAEYVSAPVAHLAHKPSSVTHDQAAAASLAALTAWQIFREKISIRKGDRILIHSAAGGVGHYAVQIAAYQGAYVVGTASKPNLEFVKGLGASKCIDYRNEPFEKVLKDIDFVLDTIGNDYIDRSIKVLRTGGTIISIPSGASGDVAEKARLDGKTGDTFRVHSDGTNMREIANMLENGYLKSYVSEVFSIDDIRAAHSKIESGRTRGKIVVSLK